MKYTFSVLALLLILFSACNASCQGSWSWGVEGRGAAGEGIAPAVDVWGNLYIAGNYYGTDTFASLILPSIGGGGGLIIVKYDTHGNVIWGFRPQNVIPGSGTHIDGISTDNLGNVYIVGFYSGTVKFGSITKVNPGGVGATGIAFLAKCSPSGNVLWVVDMTINVYDIHVVAKNDHVYVAGDFVYNLTVGPYTVTNVSTGFSADVFIAKFDTSGNVKWLKSAGGSSGDGCTSVAVTPAEHIYICGCFASPTLPFGGTTLLQTGVATSLHPATSFYLAKYDSSGNVLWATSPTGQASDNISVSTDNGEHPVIGGPLYQNTTVSFGGYTMVTPARYYGFVARYSPAGAVLWAQKITGYVHWGVETVQDACGNIWLAADFETQDTVAGHIIVASPPASSSYDPLLIACLDSMGNYITSSVSQTGGDDIVGISLDGIGEVYIGGDANWGGYYTFGPSVLHDPSGNEALFGAKFHYNAITDTTFNTIDTCIADTITLAGPAGYSVYLWNDGITVPSRKVYDTGKYWVYAAGGCGLSLAIDTFKITRSAHDISTKHTDTICVNSSVTLQADPGYNSYIWYNGSSATAIIVNTPGIYWVNAYGNCSTGNLIDTFVVTKNDVDISFSLGKDTTACAPLVLSVPVADGAYYWQDASTAQTFTALHSGTYIATVSKQGCKFSDTITVNIHDIAQHFNDTTLCKDQPIQLTLNVKATSASNVLWSTGSTQATVVIVNTGKYWVNITDTPCSVTDTFEVLSEYCDCKANVPNAFSPNRDQLNDGFKVIFEKDCEIKNYLLNIYNRWGQEVFHSEDPNEAWDGMFKGVSAELGVYMYWLKYSAGPNNNHHTRKGDITLVR